MLKCVCYTPKLEEKEYAVKGIDLFLKERKPAQANYTLTSVVLTQIFVQQNTHVAMAINLFVKC